jgi:hypothetical protein
LAIDVAVDANGDSFSAEPVQELPFTLNQPSLFRGEGPTVKVLDDIIRTWAYSGYPDGATRPMGSPSDQVHAYCLVNRESFPDGCMPEAGMDVLICPGVFWAIDPAVWGTGATLSWGFEGFVPAEKAATILYLSQLLLQAPTLCGTGRRMQEAGQIEAQKDIGHELRRCVSGVEFSIQEVQDELKAWG